MKAPGFWHRGGSRLPAALLAPLGWLYGRMTLRRMAKQGWRAPVPEISVGNFTAGGAGKTPTVIAIVRALMARGEVPFVLTRGYGGRMRGPMRVEPAHHAARDVGDEPLLLARHAPTIIARDRAAGARFAVEQGATCLVLDDGLQNPALVKDFSLAVIDGGFGFGNGFCVPAGPLRAPVGGQLGHVDAVLMIGRDETGASPHVAARPTFSTTFVPDREIVRALSGRRLLAFCGIGRPEKFRQTLIEAGLDVEVFRPFPDHHPFSERNAEALIAAAETVNLTLVTTEKDHTRLSGGQALEKLGAAAVPLPVVLPLPESLLDLLYRAVDSARKR
jgi:tetraacyldisaccharide 4'-kinase